VYFRNTIMLLCPVVWAITLSWTPAPAAANPARNECPDSSLGSIPTFFARRFTQRDTPVSDPVPPDVPLPMHRLEHWTFCQLRSLDPRPVHAHRARCRIRPIRNAYMPASGFPVHLGSE
jgi:hypothetical protein